MDDELTFGGPENKSSSKKPLLTLNFEGEAKIRKERKFAQEINSKFIPELNHQSSGIAEKIRAEIQNNLPFRAEVKVDIQFTAGSIEWLGVIAVLDMMGRVVSGIDFTKYAIGAIKFSINKIIRGRIEEKYPIRKISTKVHKEDFEGIHWLTRFLWWCSGSTIDILRDSPTDKAKFVGIGGAVFSTWVLASASGGYAFYTMFEGNQLQLGLAVLFGLIWGLIIFNIDRYIVSTLKKTGDQNRLGAFFKELGPAIPRLALAIILGLTISRPLELRLFQTEIGTRMEFNKDKLMKERAEELEAVYKNRSTTINNELDKIQEQINFKRKHAEELQAEFLRESDGTGGSGRYGYSTVAQIKEAQFNQAYKDYKQTEDSFTKRKQEFQNESNQIASTKQRLLDDYRNSIGKGFLARTQALSDLIDKEEAVKRTSYAIIALLILIEVAPVLVKLLSPYGPYDAKLNLRNEAEIKEAEYQKDSKVEIARQHYTFVTNAERQVEEAFFDSSVIVRTRKVRDAWDTFDRSFSSRNGSSAEELLEIMRESFFINRKP